MAGNLHGNALEPTLTWPAPNWVDPVRRTWIIPYAAVLQAVVTLMVGTRLWLRAKKQAGALGLDDALLVPAFLAATGFTTLVILGTERYGISLHIWDVHPKDYEPASLVAWVSEVCFLVSTCSTKVSILLFYRRLVRGTVTKRWRYAIFGAIILAVLYCLTFIILLLTNCQPVDAYWKAYSPTYKEHWTCTHYPYLNAVAGALSVFTDLYSVLLPMGMLRHFEAPKRQKIALNLIFSTGLLVVAAGCIRTYYLYCLGYHFDTTWIGYNCYIWSVLEVDLALICASAPALRVLLRKYLSDPMSRMMHTARFVTSTRNTTKRDSRQTDNGAVISHARNSPSPSSDFGEKNFPQNHTKPLETVGEDEMEMDPSSPFCMVASEPYVIRTPEDFEAYALRNLEKNRPPLRSTVSRSATSDYETGETHSTLNGPFTDWHAPRRSQG